MAVVRVNVSAAGRLSAPCGGDWWDDLRRGLDRCAPGAPVAVLVHGFRYTWRRDVAPWACPHERLYGVAPVAPCRRRRPCRAAWPLELGLAQEGLAIALAWEARVGRHGRLGFAEVHARAARAGAALAGLLEAAAAHRPGVRVDALTHSLGARVALSAGGSGPPWGRLFLLAAADWVSSAEAFLAATPGAEVVHVLSRANDPYDAAFALAAPGERRDRPLGAAGLGRQTDRWLDLQLDHPRARRWLAAVGHPLGRPPEALSHWHMYADKGAMAAYAAWLRHPAPRLLPALRAEGVPETLEPRWARLVGRVGPRPAPNLGPRHPAGDPSRA